MTDSNIPSTRKTKVLRSGDPKTRFHNASASEILKELSPPRQLLSSSAKLDKCESVGVLARVLYLTPGTFCPSATRGCLESCLGHTSGRMCFSTHTAARDARTALYLERPIVFVKRLRAELTLLEAEALQYGLRPAVRLNGTSDLFWERIEPNLFSDFPDIQFFDYTKINQRMLDFLDSVFPANYHLTFSVDACSSNQAAFVIGRGGNVAAVFWPHLPKTWWGFPVINGDTHDARFLDPSGVIVGLKAKGLARVDIQGFIIRPCPQCGPSAKAMELIRCEENTHRKTVHQCGICKATVTARWMLPEGGVRRRNVA
jgi:hypothetical protein